METAATITRQRCNGNRTSRCNHRTVSVPTTQDAIDEADETFTINNGAVSATGTIVDNDNAPTKSESRQQVRQKALLPYFEFVLSNPSAVDTTYTFTFTNGTAGDLDYNTTNDGNSTSRCNHRNSKGTNDLKIPLTELMTFNHHRSSVHRNDSG
jgi:hypothetical protein